MGQSDLDGVTKAPGSPGMRDPDSVSTSREVSRMSPSQRCDKILSIIDEVLCERTGPPAPPSARSAPARAARMPRPKVGLDGDCPSIGAARWTNDDRVD